MCFFLGSRVVAGEHWIGSPNKSIDQIRKNCTKKVPKNVFSAPPDNVLETFIGHFFYIFRIFCRYALFLGCAMMCRLQA